MHTTNTARDMTETPTTGVHEESMMRSHGERRSAGGFTLVEMLIALVITGVMAGGVITLLMGQNRFYGSTDDVVYAEQSLRATSDLLGSEIRGISPRGDVVSAGPQTLTFRMDMHRGVVCHVDASDDVYVFMYSDVTAPNLGGSTGVAFREAYSGSAFAYQDGFDPLGIRQVAADATSSVATTCESNGGPAVSANDPGQYWLFPTWPGATAPPDGAVLRVFGEVTYEFKASGFSTGGTGIFRNSQELASPFESDAAFSYVMAGGGEQSTVSTGNTGNITRVRIDATAVGDGSNKYDISRDLEYDIPLRN